MKDNFVGPVLIGGDTAEAIIRSIQKLNRDVYVEDRGSYLRVSVLNHCILTRKAIEDVLGRPFTLPNDLEKVILSFQGKMTTSQHEVIWETNKECIS